MKNKNHFVIEFQDIDQTKTVLVGGKGANLGELSKISGVRVPDGFCVTTNAFKEIIADSPDIDSLLDQLALLDVNDRKAISETSAEIRSLIEKTAIPALIRAAIDSQIKHFGQNNAYAVRSSATAEDLPTASFAGQQDTYLNVIGKETILAHISKCWASLFTDRAVTYRIQNGFDHRKVQLSVVVQKMVFPDAAGVLFTADPVNGNRKVTSIDASFGLGEALVSGIVNADHYKVRDGNIVEKKIGGKKLAIHALASGGTEEQEIDPEKQELQTLTDEQILQLSDLGRTIEAHFGSPQDIEWCLSGNTFYIVQSRPITTLFPIPQIGDQVHSEDIKAVYVSVGHQQMMTDAMKPLGLSVFLLLTPAKMRTAAGRLFVDVAPNLASPALRDIVLNKTLGKSDPLIKDALLNILERKDFIQFLPEDQAVHSNSTPKPAAPPSFIDDPNVVTDLIRQSETSLARLKSEILEKSGSDLLDFIREDIQQWKKSMFDSLSTKTIMSTFDALAWINYKMNEWLGEKNAADTLTQSVPNNVTSEMGLALLDVADVIRPSPEVIDYLQHEKDDQFLDQLVLLEGGKEAWAAINAFLEKYGVRCAGEIDITRPRWIEKPATLIPVILGNIKNFEPGASQRKFEEGRRQALEKEKDLLSRLEQLPDGETKARETKRMIDLIRNFTGYREYPKYGMVSRFFVYRQALLKEAEKLVEANVIGEKEAIYYLTFDELCEVVRTKKLDNDMVLQRKEAFKSYEKLTPPRVMTSEGEVVTGSYNKENLPDGAIAGLAVSSGIIEGRARVILSMEHAELEDGDILITAFTDPSWTPLFVSIRGLVTEVGGLMTHGAVIAREYGLPAVVGVENATKLIRDGQRIRVNGTDGYVELL
ncbi:phosphoenolpyruvate synthase [Dyadobacter sp. CY347]|uniref:phosphoenolpyruvate synthase n=1 Tax=Dyadobacter sp. CY347 TaxID=2909336 RepID=UPI001F00C965|nr:phosphoenolpyruvate synthase [Dyadobacter sp. CY347]MCF2489879.1 phosphoenolpyruvate synthase [Dyadobacter sp. CY347]